MNPLKHADKDKPQRMSWTQTYGPYWTMGMELAFVVVGMFFIGRWLDGLLGTDSWLMFVGLGVGVAGGFFRFFKKAIAMGKAEDEVAREERLERRGED